MRLKKITGILCMAFAISTIFSGCNQECKHTKEDYQVYKVVPDEDGYYFEKKTENVEEDIQSLNFFYEDGEETKEASIQHYKIVYGPFSESYYATVPCEECKEKVEAHIFCVSTDSKGEEGSTDEILSWLDKQGEFE